MAAKSIPAGAAERSVLGQWAAALTERGPMTEAVTKAAAGLLGGFLLSGLSVLGRPMPTALALLAALPFGLPAVLAYGGAVAGYVLFWTLPLAIEPIAAGFLILAELCIFADLLPRDRAWFMPVSSALLYGLIGFIGLLQKGFALGETALLLARLAVLGLCCLGFTQAMQGKRTGRLLLGFCLLGGCTAIRLPGAIPLSLLLASALSFLSLGSGKGLLYAVAGGLLLELCWDAGASMAAVYAFNALLLHGLPLAFRPLRAGVYLSCTALGLLLTGGLQTAALLGTLAGLLPALLVPEEWVQALLREDSGIPQARLGEIGRVADVLTRVARTLSRTRLQNLETQSAAIFDRAAEQACKSCGRWFYCWESRATETYHALSGCATRILSRGAAKKEDLPTDFLMRCHDVDGFVTAVNEALDDQFCRRQYQTRLSESRMVVAGQFAAAARLLQRVTEPEPSQPLPLAFTPQLGYRSHGIRGEEVSGDHGCCFTVGEWYYVLLCDGMGTGEEASQESLAAIGILRDLIRAGLEAQDALEALNGVYILRGDGVFSTVDLLQMSLITGEGFLLKWGAAPSFVKTALGVEKLGTGTLPPGLSVNQGAKADCLRVRLSDGQLLALLSDGAEDTLTAKRMESYQGEDPKELAAKLAMGTSEDDDRMAVVLRLLPREKRGK